MAKTELGLKTTAVENAAALVKATQTIVSDAEQRFLAAKRERTGESVAERRFLDAERHLSDTTLDYQEAVGSLKKRKTELAQWEKGMPVSERGKQQ
jgi:hypothetical protein